MSYAPARDPLTLESAADIGRISVYAQGQDYHDVVKKGLKALARWLIDEAGGALKVFVDTAPVMEKPLAQAAGLGWQGKHSNLVSRRHGSWLFLGAIYTTLELAPDSPGRNRCGSCNACQQACPRSEEHTSELQSLMRISYAVFCLKKKTEKQNRSKYKYKNHYNNKHKT